MSFKDWTFSPTKSHGFVNEELNPASGVIDGDFLCDCGRMLVFQYPCHLIKTSMEKPVHLVVMACPSCSTEMKLSLNKGLVMIEKRAPINVGFGGAGGGGTFTFTGATGGTY